MASCMFIRGLSCLNVCSQEHRLLLSSRVIHKLYRIPSANISHKDRIDEETKADKPAPYPYKTKRYRWIHYYYGQDSTIARFDENTVFISVEGPPASNKTQLAAGLADLLGMKHYEEPNLDPEYINDYGFDLRAFNKLLHRDAQHPDHELFLRDPTHPRAGLFQHRMLRIRFWQALDMELHLLSTGQGCIQERSHWSDVVFNEAMYKAGYISKDIYDFYLRKRWNCFDRLARPHVVIYIDTPKEKVLENIKKRNIPYEVNSPVWESNFVDTIIKCYKEKVLPEYEEHAYMLTYDYQDNWDCEKIVRDLEELDFVSEDMRGTRHEDWKFVPEDFEWDERRYENIEFFNREMGHFELPSYDVPGYYYSDESLLAQGSFEKYLQPRGYTGGYDPMKESKWRILLGLNGRNYYQERMKWNHFRCQWLN
ncbi:NADH dehydrogenase (ubiquinone) subunit ND-42 [Brevipalpus obovatus]|uniref:NADH dehydrogenase (ubiquinone) subunit ND-42 n=1 Tax=Brevipalpus obovatus TaxID=246614 RepID=UPI003D9E329A